MLSSCCGRHRYPQRVEEHLWDTAGLAKLKNGAGDEPSVTLQQHAVGVCIRSSKIR